MMHTHPRALVLAAVALVAGLEALRRLNDGPVKGMETVPFRAVEIAQGRMGSSLKAQPEGAVRLASRTRTATRRRWGRAPGCAPVREGAHDGHRHCRCPRRPCTVDQSSSAETTLGLLTSAQMNGLRRTESSRHVDAGAVVASAANQPTDIQVVCNGEREVMTRLTARRVTMALVRRGRGDLRHPDAA